MAHTDMSVTDVQEILEERARKLARPMTVTEPGETLDLVTFSLASETYGVEASYVVEVFRLAHLSPLPGATSPVFGVVAWRGNLLIILDVRSALGLSSTSLNDLGHVIVLGSARPAFGVLVDTVHGVRSIPAHTVSNSGGGEGADLIRGVTADAVVVLNASQLLQLYA